MKILTIKKYPRFKNHFKIIFDDDKSIIVEADTIVKFNLKKDLEIDDEQLKKIEKFSNSNKIMSYAFFLISKKMFSKKSLEDKLIFKGFAKEDVDRVILRFTELNYLNDEVFAQNLISYLQKKCKGRYYIENELKQHNIDIKILKQITDNASQYTEIIAIMKKRYPKFNNKDAGETKKIAAFFLRRGFSSEDIAKAFRKYGTDIDL
ncbi:MAG: regulatory protein RecX [Endomicrobiaceae bacterium]|nr:regulatory protein RecX [Endomicrobiaceae bacterium]